MTEYQQQVREALHENHPEFWQRMQIAQLERNPMLFGYWQLMLKQSHREGLEPKKAAKRFVSATRRRRFH